MHAQHYDLAALEASMTTSMEASLARKLAAGTVSPAHRHFLAPRTSFTLALCTAANAGVQAEELIEVAAQSVGHMLAGLLASCFEAGGPELVESVMTEVQAVALRGLTSDRKNLVSIEAEPGGHA